MTRLFFRIRISDFALLVPATFKDAQHVSRLRDLPSLEGIEIRQYPFFSGFFRRWRGPGDHPLRRPVAPVALAKTRIFYWVCAVVVKGSTPQHRAVRHHAGAYLA